jgi:hypothetical protein
MHGKTVQLTGGFLEVIAYADLYKVQMAFVANYKFIINDTLFDQSFNEYLR